MVSEEQSHSYVESNVSDEEVVLYGDSRGPGVYGKSTSDMSDEVLCEELCENYRRSNLTQFPSVVGFVLTFPSAGRHFQARHGLTRLSHDSMGFILFPFDVVFRLCRM